MKSDHPRFRSLLIRVLRSLVSASAVFALMIAVWIATVSLAFALDSPGSIPTASVHVVPWIIWIATVIALIRAIPLKLSTPTLAVCLVFLVYMAWDDPRPVPPLELPEIVSESSESYVAYCWLLEGDPRSRLSEAVTFELDSYPGSEDWPGRVRDRRQAIEDAYTNDRLGSEWIRAMASHPPQGMFPPRRVDSSSPNFEVILTGCKIRLARAQLLLHDDHADEAAQALIPLLRAAFSLQRAGTSLLDQLAALVLVQESCEQLERILDSSDLSEPIRRELAASLGEAPAVASNVSRAILGEKAFGESFRDEVIRAASGESSSLFPQGFQGKRFPFLTRCIINPNRTFHEHLALLNHEEMLAKQRPDGQTNSPRESSRFRRIERTFKNSVGRALVELSVPEYQRIAAPFWEVDDMRLDLLRRLEAAPAP